ncbi:MAG: hypothetical protein ACRD3O_03735, partial [Terriglobia bacterium]
GLANWDKQYGEFYIEQVGVVALALQEALVQDYDGLLRIAPAVPAGWEVDGNVYMRGKTKVDVQVRNGVVTTAVIEAGATQDFKVRNPWPGQQADVISARTGAKVVKADADSTFGFHGIAGTSYLLERHDASLAHRRFAPVSGAPAGVAKRLGRVQIGLFASGQ